MTLGTTLSTLGHDGDYQTLVSSQRKDLEWNENIYMYVRTYKYFFLGVLFAFIPLNVVWLMKVSVPSSSDILFSIKNSYFFIVMCW